MLLCLSNLVNAPLFPVVLMSEDALMQGQVLSALFSIIHFILGEKKKLLYCFLFVKCEICMWLIAQILNNTCSLNTLTQTSSDLLWTFNTILVHCQGMTDEIHPPPLWEVLQHIHRHRALGFISMLQHTRSRQKRFQGDWNLILALQMW